MDSINSEARAFNILGSFQLMEFALKCYIGFSYGIIKHTLGGKIPFDYDFKQVDKMPLGRLLSIFKRLNGNTELQARLNKLVERRNEVAHRALLFQHEIFKDLFDLDLLKHHHSLKNTEEELDQCMLLLGKELESVAAIHKSVEA